MELRTYWAVVFTVFTTWGGPCIAADLIDRPCAARQVKSGQVCVCTAEYCDTITRQPPESGTFVSYVSSEEGLRFHKTVGSLKHYAKGSSYTNVLELDVGTQYQAVNGFGGAVTDAAGINWKNLTDQRLMDHLIQSYCGDSGIQYNMLRVPIGGTDFSTRAYAYNELPENDVTLSNFTLAYEDYEYKIPMIKACMKAASAPIHILSATWSPPIWMKTNNAYSGHSHLRKEYRQTYADYHYKFLEHYAAEGIPVWGISIANEPLYASVNYVPTKINNMGWTLDAMSEYVLENLGPTLRGNNSDFKHVKIIAGDDLRFTITLFWNIFVAVYPETLEYLDGAAVHYYMSDYVPAAILSQAMKDYPGKFVVATEISAGALPSDTITVDIGSWSRAQLYVNDIMQNFGNDVIGWLDWNMCLNTEGKPSYIGASVDSPILVNAEDGEFYKQPMFYAIGHFSKFVPRGSRRIKVNVDCGTKIQNVAFLTPYNTVVVVIHNEGPEENVRLRLGDEEAELLINANSITTVEMLNSGHQIKLFFPVFLCYIFYFIVLM
ncbi:lysosomal acid glucosylceramidase [Spodoptera frugiperda]|uniref:Glucosylceramidase n=1 Tax=Spodoptera frugiperda TaxID=7108 RepID=A0A9R0DCV1_SPOFR|nr:lysosomal acid glucosylceramidase [Spodoptera frugiperda]